MRGRRWIFLFVKLTFSGGLLFFLFNHISVIEIFHSLQKASSEYVILGMLMMPIFTYIGSYQMELILTKQGVLIKAVTVMVVNFSTAFYALFLPGIVAGGAIRWYKLSHANKKHSEVLASIVFNRLFNTISMLVLGVAFFFLDQSSLSNVPIGSAMVACLSFLSIAYMILFRSAFAIRLKGFLGRFAFIPQKIRDKIYRLLDAAIEFRSLSVGDLFIFSVLSVAHHLFGIFSTYFFCLSLKLPVTIITVCWIRSLIFFVLLMPVSFSGIGVREGSLVLLLQSYGVSPASAMSLSFLLLGRDILGGLIGGVIELKYLFRKPGFKRFES